MATTSTKKPARAKKPAKGATPTTKRPRKTKPQASITDLKASELALEFDHSDLTEVAEAVVQSKGAVLGAYRDPLGGHPLLLASLPIDDVAPTSFQRDASPAHVKKLVQAIGKSKRFLDPLIVMRERDGKWLTPNGHHRLIAMRALGAKSITVLVVPDRTVAYQILALNVEKAHNLRERGAEVRRLMIDLANWAEGGEKDFELELDEPSLVTIGFAYEARPRISGGAYVSVLKRVDEWVDGTLKEAIAERRRRAELVVHLDDAVNEAIKRLEAGGLKSPFLRAFVVGRINPLRFIKGDLPSFDELLETMTTRATKLDGSKISSTDLAATSGAAPEEDA